MTIGVTVLLVILRVGEVPPADDADDEDECDDDEEVDDGDDECVAALFPSIVAST